jgi:23S rRNA (cytidine1920-2'-O)/16S rRNA (cytidine1409-2'-O)-methyltransferase
MKVRLDDLLVSRGFYNTRSRARDAILRGTVKINEQIAQKPGQMIATNAPISIEDPAQSFVSRAALKLIKGLEHFQKSPKGLTALDIGSSTGGFIEVLLQNDALHVYGVDVGHNQLHERLRNHPRVTNIEKLNAKDLNPHHLNNEPIGFITSDVSFISLKRALVPALTLAASNAACILLVKPQFEAGRDAIGKGGILKNRTDGVNIAHDLSNWLDTIPQWRAIGLCESPIEGADGNQEFLLCGVKDV